MSAHTPGPWLVVDEHYSDSVCVTDAKGFQHVSAAHTATLLDYHGKLGISHWADSPEAVRELSPEEQAANARLIASAPALLEALQWQEQLNRRKGEGYDERFERVAEVFRRDTGFLAPGKDASPAAGNTTEERQAAWDEWIAAGIARTRAAIAAATGTASAPTQLGTLAARSAPPQGDGGTTNEE